MRKKSLVRGDDDLAVLERVENDLFGEAGAADEFDDNLCAGIVEHGARVAAQHAPPDSEALKPHLVLVTNPFQMQTNAEAFGDALQAVRFLVGMNHRREQQEEARRGSSSRCC